MSEIISFESRVFLLFVLHGICLVLCIDVLRSWRMAVSHGPLWMGLEDFSFWFAAGLRTFVLIFIYQDGVLRLYTAAAMALGMFLYHKIASRWVVRGISGAFCKIVGVFLWIIQKINIFRQKTVAKFVKKAYTGNSSREGNV